MEILKTKQYDLFKHIKGNRVISQNHVDYLVKSMKKKYYVSPIHVNEDMEIIDGQHRLAACKILGYDVYYYVSTGTDLSSVQSLNANSKNWGIQDFIKSHADRGNKNYKIFIEFCAEYGFNPTVGLCICGVDTGGRTLNHIANGGLSIPDINQAYVFANKLKKIAVFYKGSKRRSFIMALRRCMKVDGFDIDVFIEKLSLQSSRLVDCPKIEDYVSIIEQIYNYKSHSKINLRF